MATQAAYLGLISGTSADGIDAALVRFEPRFEMLAARTFPYPDGIRTAVLALARSEAAIGLHDFGRLDVAIGAAFADAATALLADTGFAATDVAAIGSHGQTVCHDPTGARPFTLQIGDPTVIAERAGILTVADFRRADVAAGGQGAPLLPALHAALFATPDVPRAILNLGGIANLTLLEPGRPVRGFDTGPANCLLDAWALRHLGSPCDAGGRWAAGGRVRPELLARWLADPWFPRPPPKSTGREYFNLGWVEARLAPSIPPADVQATLLALTACSIAEALHRHAPDVREVYACGGGVHNPAVMQALADALDPARLATTAALGLDPDFVEAVGFAWLARERLAGRPGNLPEVTGARGPRLLGAVHAPPPA